ncbi:alpha/beta fold hydrolase [Micromonospora aurantiaca]|uniref:alpha/beta fold hydrolase n=1 Tax=Micromonospora aurantiaca (nom. illeg.) TaxID=47850 RepID=UPI0033D5552A
MSGDYTQEFVDVDGARIGVQVYPEPAGPPGAPVVLIWPAMGVRARYYRPFAAALRDAGLAVIVADLRGTGESTPAPSRACRYGYQEMATDIGAVLDALKPRLDGRTRLLLGHSLGGQVAVLHQALHDDDRVDGLALVAVGLPWWRRYPGLRGWACCRTPTRSRPRPGCSASGRAGASAAGRPPASSGTGRTRPAPAASPHWTGWTRRPPYGGSAHLCWR